MKKKTNPGPKKQKTPKYNNISCPKGMTIENWQTALRKQAAEREHLAVIGPADTDSNFEVRNPKTTRRSTSAIMDPAANGTAAHAWTSRPPDSAPANISRQSAWPMKEGSPGKISPA